MRVNPGSHFGTQRALLYVCRALLQCLLLMGCLVSAAYAQDVQVRAELSASTITRDESVTLTITAIGIDAELDIASLYKDFDVVGRSSSRQISTVIDSNNQAVNTSVVTWALELLPMGEGVFTVPAVKVGDYETQLMTLTVNAVPSGARRDVFLETSVDTTTPWVQSQVVMTLRVFQAIEIVDGGLDIPSADDLVVERIGEDTRSREIRDGREYSVTERRFALYPQKSGRMVIDPVSLSVTVPADPNRVRGFFSPTRKLTRRGDAITLNVQARPPAGSAWWLPAKSLELQSQWQGDPGAAQVDQPLTRTLVLRAEGVLDSQLPPINIPAVDGISLYAEEPSVAMLASGTGLSAEMRINWALIPQRAGELLLPEISVEWFNTLTGEREFATLEAEKITVLPAGSTTGASAANGNSAPASAPLSGTGETIDALNESAASTPNTDSDNANALSAEPAVGANNSQLPAQAAMILQLDELQDSRAVWRLLALLAFALWLLSLCAWWWVSRRQAGTLPATRNKNSVPSGAVSALYQQLVPLGQIDQACQQGNLPAIKQALLAWAARQWEGNAPVTLDALSDRLPPGKARDKLAGLQRALYSQQADSGTMAVGVSELADLPDDLKAALQALGKEPAEVQTHEEAVRATTGSSRLPRL